MINTGANRGSTSSAIELIERSETEKIAKRATEGWESDDIQEDFPPNSNNPDTVVAKEKNDVMNDAVKEKEDGDDKRSIKVDVAGDSLQEGAKTNEDKSDEDSENIIGGADVHQGVAE